MAEQPDHNLALELVRDTSLVMRSRSGITRMIESQHRWDKLMKISQISYANPNLAIPD